MNALADAMSVKPKIAKKYLQALERLLVKQLRETGMASIPRIAAMRRTMKSSRPEQERKVFGILKQIPARPETVIYKATLLKQFRDQL